MVGGPVQIGAQAIALPVQRQFDRAEFGEIAHEIGPRDVYLPLVEATLQVDLQSESEKAGHDVAGGGVVAVVEDRTHLERRLRLAEGALHAPEALVRAGDVLGAQRGGRAQDKLAVQPRVPLHRRPVDGDAPLGHCDEALEADVADDGLRAVGQRVLELGQDGLACGRVLLRLVEVPADDIPLGPDVDFLDLERRPAVDGVIGLAERRLRWPPNRWPAYVSSRRWLRRQLQTKRYDLVVDFRGDLRHLDGLVLHMGRKQHDRQR